MSLQAEGTSDRVHWDLSKEDARFVLLMLRKSQDEYRKVTPDYPKEFYNAASVLDIRIEKVKTEMAKAL